MANLGGRRRDACHAFQNQRLCRRESFCVGVQSRHLAYAQVPRSHPVSERILHHCSCCTAGLDLPLSALSPQLVCGRCRKLDARTFLPHLVCSTQKSARLREHRVVLSNACLVLVNGRNCWKSKTHTYSPGEDPLQLIHTLYVGELRIHLPLGLVRVFLAVRCS